MHVGLVFDKGDGPDIDHLDVQAQPQIGTMVDLLGETFIIYRMTLVVRDAGTAPGIHTTRYVASLARYSPTNPTPGDLL